MNAERMTLNGLGKYSSGNPSHHNMYIEEPNVGSYTHVLA